MNERPREGRGFETSNEDTCPYVKSSRKEKERGGRRREREGEGDR
jgi:hypothetical protein